ncbi:MAG: hypothetical protein K9M03_04565 [Kiritimatiellales bacterium]|nr:hypothetical protein [Kiritimatiellales bacterium]
MKTQPATGNIVINMLLQQIAEKCPGNSNQILFLVVAMQNAKQEKFTKEENNTAQNATSLVAGRLLCNMNI